MPISKITSSDHFFPVKNPRIMAIVKLELEESPLLSEVRR